MPIPHEISPLIDKIIEQRSEQLRVIAGYFENVHNINGAIKELKDALNNLLQHPQVTEELKSRLQEFETVSTSWSGEIVSALERLNNAEKRLARKAVTIGCSGQARVGKSTLLQTIGNLPEEAIPTGEGIPVTAVRSRLKNSYEQRAFLHLRDKKTFIDELIKPFHRELNLPEIYSFEEFKNFDYNQDAVATDKNVQLLGRLKDMHVALSSYEMHLTGETEKIEDLTQLRPWVAYPTQEEEKDPNYSRLYLAVKNVEIECSFLVDVEKLMLVDLPGLGEVNVDAEEHHVQGLKNEVDLVLMILRPTEISSYWGDKDQKALKLINRAVEGISKWGDFVIIVVNCGENDNIKRYETLVKDLHKQLNENTPDSRYQILTCDAKNPDSVREKVLVPVLNHLIARLPVMDNEIIESSFSQWQTTLEKISRAINELERSLRIFPSQGSPKGNVFQKAKELRGDLAVKLGEVIQELKEEVKKEQEEGSIIDNNLIQAIEEKHETIKNWAENGLERGQDEWYQIALRRFQENQTVIPFASEEINRARSYLTDTYSQLDVYFGTKIKKLWIQISNIISSCTGNLIAETSPGQEALEKFLILIGEKGIGDPFPSLRKATEYLLKCGKENAIFQSHLLPTLVEITQEFTPEKFNVANVSYEVEQAEKIVFDIISQKIIQISYNVNKKLREKPFVSNILYSAAVKFEDSLVRSTDVDEQFFKFASLYTNEIWADEFQEIQNNYAMVERVEQAITNLKQLLISK